MRNVERLALYIAVAAALILALRAGPSISGAAHAGEGEASPVPRIAVCSLYQITDDLMDSNRFKPARMEYETQLRDESLKPLMDQLQELQRSVEGLDKSDPGFSEAREKFFRLQAAANKATQEIAQKVERKVAEQLVESYRLVEAAAVDVAADLGFNYVIASNNTRDELKQETVAGLVRDMLGRPVLMHPDAADITEDVRQDLKLE